MAFRPLARQVLQEMMDSLHLLLMCRLLNLPRTIQLAAPLLAAPLLSGTKKMTPTPVIKILLKCCFLLRNAPAT